MPDPVHDTADDSAATSSPTGAGAVLATYLPHTLLVGDYEITPEGTEVAASDVDAVLAAAQQTGVAVFEIGGDS